MSQFIIIMINLVVLTIGGHVWQVVKKAYMKRGALTGVRYGVTLGTVFFSCTAAANVFMYHIAEVSATLP